MKHKSLLALLACSSIFALPAAAENNPAAQTYANVEAYIKYITNGHSAKIRTVNSSAVGNNVFGGVRWHQPGDDNPELASVFVLERLPDGAYREVIRSKPDTGLNRAGTEVLDGIEIDSKIGFTVALHRFRPTGTINYRFSLMDREWRLAGRDEQFLYFDFEGGDEAVGDTRTQRSSNFLNGEIVEKRFKKNKIISKKITKASFPRFLLADFQFFDERHGEL